MPTGKFLSYRPKQNSLKFFLSYCPLFERGTLRWSPAQCCLVIPILIDLERYEFLIV